MASSQTHHGNGVEVAKGHVPASAEEDTTKAAEVEAPRSLKQRLADIRDEAFGIGKSDIEMQGKDGGKKFTIKGHTFEAVLSELRPVFARHGVMVTPNLVERTYAGNRCDVLVDFLFERTDDSDETRTIRWGGAGTDNGDKAFAKAGTNAVKEMLKKVFLVTDREDAKEETEAVEHQTEEGITRKDAEAARVRIQAAIAQWAKTFKAALESAGTAADVQRLERENRDQLTDESLPDVTRTFFIELIQSRKAALAG